MRTIEMHKARVVAQLLGVPAAARYLKIRGWSVEAAAWILTRH